MVTKELVGLCGHHPRNFPVGDDYPQVVPALAAGCTIVVAGRADAAALALAELAERAGVPAGVFSIVTGKAAAIGAAMMPAPSSAN